MTKEMINKYMREINRNPIVFKDIENPSYELCREAVKREPVLIKYIANPSEEICQIAISKRPYSIFHIKNPSKESCLLAVRKNGYAIELLENPDEDICIEAIKQEPNAICFIKNQTYNICLYAIKRDGTNLRHVKKGILDESKHIIKKIDDIIIYANYIEDKWRFSVISENKKNSKLNNVEANDIVTELLSNKEYENNYDSIKECICEF